VASALGGIDTLRIQAGGALASLPFAILQAAEAGEDPSWLIDRFALVSLSDLTPRAAAGRERADPRFLAVAAPLPFAAAGADASLAVAEIADYYRGGQADVTALSQLPPLAQSRVEAETIAGFFGPARSRLLLGAEASEAGLRGAPLRDASVLLFATHGLISGEMEGVAEPALVLSPPESSADEGDDGLLTASEIAMLDLDADLVILSACNSAAGGLAGLPAFTGLAQAFRQAGTDLLMVSHWPVRDDVAAYLSIETLKAAREGLSRPQALRAAIMKLRAERTIAGADEPHAWAPFVLLD
jgi:CHAT domain-containing protein